MTRARRTVAVVGTGAVGSMAAWRLAARGLEVHAFDRWGTPHDRGAAAGQSRRFTVIAMADQLLPPVTRHAETLWRQLEAESGRRLLEQKSGLIIGPRSSPGVEAALRGCEAWGIDHRLLDTDSLRDRYPQHAVRGHEVAIHDPSTGLIRPEAAILAATERARAGDARVHGGADVVDVQVRSASVRLTVRVAPGRFEHRTVDSLVLAPGAWAATEPWRGLLADVLTQPLVARRLVQTWFVAREPARYEADVFPVFERVGLPGGASIYGFPTQDGVTVKVGVKTRPHDLVADPAAPHAGLSPGHLEEIREVVAEQLPGLHPQPVQTTLAVEGYSADGQPVVGTLPGSPHVAVAVGFSGAGFKYAPAVGDALAGLIAEGRTSVPLSHMAPSPGCSGELSAYE